MSKLQNHRELRIPLQAVVYRHAKWWIAHCLELDLVAEGKTPARALKDLMELSTTQIESAVDSGDLETVFRPAPSEVWALFSRSREVALPTVRKGLSRSVDRFEAREAVLL
jgi:hypothetical protein